MLYKTDRNCQHKHKKPTSKTMARSTKSKRSSQRDKKTGCPTSLTLRVHNQNVSSFSLHGSHPSEVALTQIIITPLHQCMLSVLGPLLQKLGNNFIHTLNKVTHPPLQSTTTVSTLLLSMKVENCSTRLPLQISPSIHYQRIFIIYTTSGGLRSMAWRMGKLCSINL